MCQECGCGLPGSTKIDGKPAEQIGSPLIRQARSGHPDDDEHGHNHSHFHEHIQQHQDDHANPHTHSHMHTHSHHGHSDEHDEEHEPGRHRIELHESVFAANDRLAERNRGFFRALNLLVLNILSSPGSGKTTFLQKTIEKLGISERIGVIVGDLETDYDAQRLRTTGAKVVQITTGTLCHLDAEMVARAIGRLNTRELDILFIENVGNLVCPSSFDLGEDVRVAMLSVTEGEDKPLKYPPLFHSADVIVLSKSDMTDAAEFDRETATSNIARVNPRARLFEVSAKRDQGMDEWCEYLRGLRDRSGFLPRRP